MPTVFSVQGGVTGTGTGTVTATGTGTGTGTDTGTDTDTVTVTVMDTVPCRLSLPTVPAPAFWPISPYTRIMERLGRSNPRVKWLRRAVRERPAGRVVVDGKKLVEDLVYWGVTLEELYVAEGLEGSPLAAAAERTFLVADSVLEAIAPTRHPQGMLAVVNEPAVSEWFPDGVVALLEGVQDPGNVGAVVRSAAGLGLDAVMLSPGCADPWHPAAVRGSAGAVFRLPVVRDADPEPIAARVRKDGGSVWAAAPGGQDAGTWQPRRPVLLLLGNEGSGLKAETFDLADGVVSIPLARDVESLNVAVAAGILLWHATRGAVKREEMTYS